MAITRWTPAFSLPTGSRDVANFQDEVNRLFDSFFSGPRYSREAQVFAPAVDIEEAGDEFIIRADLPGMTLKDVKVALMGDVLTIRGERTLEGTREKANMLRIERAYGTFERSFNLGTPVRNDKVRATYRDGVLEVHVPKAEEAKLREIEVQVA